MASSEGDGNGGRHRLRPISQRFQSAVAMIRSLPKEGPYTADNKTKLRFYALYKQATEGACHGSKPGFWDVVGKAKWEAWSICGNMKKEMAMQLYVEELTEMVKKMPQTSEVTDFLESISPFLPDTEEKVAEEDEKREEERVTVTSLNSSVLHGVNDLEQSQVVEEEEDEEEEEGEGEEEEEEEEDGDGGRERRDEGSFSSNDDYQESFQDLQGTSGELSSPWQHVSPESLSASFEVVSTSPLEQTSVAREHPLPQPSNSQTNNNRDSPEVAVGDSSSGEGVNGSQGTLGERSLWSGPAHLGGGVVAEVRLVREKVERAVEQLQAFSETLQRVAHELSHQQFGGDVPAGQTGSQPVSRVSRRQRRLLRVIPIALLLLGWPLLVHFLIAYFFKRGVSAVPLWVWSALSAAQLLFSFLLTNWGIPL